MTDITDDEWSEWINSSGHLPGDPPDGDSLEGLLSSRMDLVDALTGDLCVELSAKVVRAQDADAEAAMLRAAGRTVRVDPHGVGLARVVVIRHRLNLFELCQFASINRRAVVASLELHCTAAPGGRTAALARLRAIYRPALMTGRAPEPPAETAAPVPAVSDVLLSADAGAVSSAEIARRVSWLIDTAANGVEASDPGPIGQAGPADRLDAFAAQLENS
jgi:hypothetical protein